MAINTAYWQGLGDRLGWAPSYRDPIPNSQDSDPRQRGYVDYFIIHHTATPNEAVAADLFLPGGRTVSAQWLLCADGKFRPNIPMSRRAYTSASWLDDIADTVETVNTSGGPAYEISDLEIMALAIMAVYKYRTGRLKAISRSYIIGHYEVLGISGSGYATSCPGPNTTEADRRLDLVVEVAQAIHRGQIGAGRAPHGQGAGEMKVFQRGDKKVFFADESGGEPVMNYGTGLNEDTVNSSAMALWGPEPMANPGDARINVGKQIAERRYNAKVEGMIAALADAVRTGGGSLPEPGLPIGSGGEFDIVLTGKAVPKEAQ